MKLIYCNECRDVVRLIETKWRRCYCGLSGGQYNKGGVTATVGGSCRVIGIPNTFFKKAFQRLTTPEAKQAYRDKFPGWGTSDCWYGEFKGDRQIFRIDSARGPRLKIKVARFDRLFNEVTVVDNRKYRCNGGMPKSVLVENWTPSFRGRKKK